jgi:tRNA (guanine37-N1)-methyltransferase
VLLSGHHENIRKWRRFESIKKTLKARPDIVDYEKLSKEDKKNVQKIQAEDLDI